MRRAKTAWTMRWAGAVVGAAVLTGSVAVALPSGAGASVPTKVIPFTTATATGGDGSYTVSWSAPAGAGTVAVYASQSPTAQTSSGQVGQGRATGSVTASGLAAPSARWYFTLAPQHGQDLVVAVRDLGMPGVPNLRDVGDYRTTDGQWVRPGIVYRSGQLSGLPSTDQAELQALAMKDVVDLRTTAEQQASPDTLPSTVTWVDANVMAGNPALESNIETEIAKFIADPTGESPKAAAATTTSVMETFYRAMITLPSADKAFATLYQDIAALPAGSSLDFHCTAGKDRTGWATAALLLELGVPEKTVMQDYLLSNTYALGQEYAPVMQAFLAKGGNKAVLLPVLGVEKQLLDTSLAAMKQKYGTIGNYFAKGLGLSPQTIAQLKGELLAGQPS